MVVIDASVLACALLVAGPARVRDQRGTYQESCPLGVLELSTSLNLTSI